MLLQDEVIKSKSEQFVDNQAAAKRSFSDVVKQHSARSSKQPLNRHSELESDQRSRSIMYW